MLAHSSPIDTQSTYFPPTQSFNCWPDRLFLHVSFLSSHKSVQRGLLELLLANINPYLDIKWAAGEPAHNSLFIPQSLPQISKATAALIPAWISEDRPHSLCRRFLRYTDWEALGRTQRLVSTFVHLFFPLFLSILPAPHTPQEAIPCHLNKQKYSSFGDRLGENK